MVCGAVQTVTNSLLAREMAMGSGGSSSSFRPGLGGSGTTGRVTVVTAVPPSPGSTVIFGATPPRGVGDDEARLLERLRSLAAGLEVEAVGQHDLALAVDDRRS